jgi:uncharacterized protein (TIGR04255 family)
MLKISRRSVPKKGLLRASQLPNAPLAEVIFELRWNLPGMNTPDPFKNDPGYYVFVDKFVGHAKAQGFGFVRLMSTQMPVVAHSIERRFSRTENDLFPLLQTGPGILAVNESANYRWDAYRDLCVSSVKQLFGSYPSMSDFALQPISLELRYIDSFNNDAQSSRDVINFLERDTIVSINAPRFVAGNLAKLNASALALKYSVDSMDDTNFHVNIGNGTANGVDCINLTSRVLSNISSPAKFLSGGSPALLVRDGLESAHAVTSPFFKEFVKPHLMDKFTGSQNVGN